MFSFGDKIKFSTCYSPTRFKRYDKDGNPKPLRRAKTFDPSTGVWLLTGYVIGMRHVKIAGLDKPTELVWMVVPSMNMNPVMVRVQDIIAE